MAKRFSTAGLFSRRGSQESMKYEYEITFVSAEFPYLGSELQSGSYQVEWKRGKRHSGCSERVKPDGTAIRWGHTFILRSSIYRQKDGSLYEKLLTIAVKLYEGSKRSREVGVCSVDLAMYTTLAITRETQTLNLPLTGKQMVAFQDAKIQITIKCNIAASTSNSSLGSGSSIYSLTTPPPPPSRGSYLVDEVSGGLRPPSPPGPASTTVEPTRTPAGDGPADGSISGDELKHLYEVIREKDEEIEQLRVEVEKLSPTEGILTQREVDHGAFQHEMAIRDASIDQLRSQLKDFQREFDSLKEHYFASVNLNIKLVNPFGPGATMTEPELFDEVNSEQVPWRLYTRWLMKRLLQR